ncbi:MAG TPA: protease pro-enzyme activation domain-containing protein [Terracidiphilus sp.]|nr:protease pro-enzyme activation domain-containing protein [Terracidiphilus sp.]
MRRRLACSLVATALAVAACAAQTPAPRILSQPTSAQMSPLQGSLHPFAQSRLDAGSMPSDTRLNGMSIYFNHTPEQQAALEQLLADQQNPSSPLYHRWLTPQQFAARFGMAQSDIDKVELWLEQQGFSVDSVSHSHNLIRFSGTAGQVDQAFQTQMHYFNVDGKKIFAPSTALSVPAAFAATVANVGNLSSFRPRPQYVPYKPANPRAAFTSSQSGSVYFAPGDIKVAYDMNPIISSGIDGTGQTIAIVGQSAVSLADITNFQNAAVLTPKSPIPVLVPGSGTAAFYAGDQGESDLDLEWSSTMAPGATVYFIYTGSNPNYDVFDSIDFAIDNRLGNVISASYGACEAGNAPSTLSQYESIYAQASAQGQTIVAASGDQGSTACFISPTTTSPSLSIQESLSVNYPASSQYVTAVGGTEITDANIPTAKTSNQYFTYSGTTDTLTSVLKYIPEVAWNDDDSAYGLSATGGGLSTIFSRPSWQKGVPGIPSGSFRAVPDISLYASPNNPGYLYCTSDTSDWNTTSSPAQTASCNSGFRDASTQYLTVAGGTSFAAPIFAGMVAILNQKAGYTSGQGLVNPTLYTLASHSTTYSTVFHDIIAGDPNGASGVGSQCLAGSTYCSGAALNDYGTTAGYDLATGLGSFDFAALAGVWPANSAPLIGTTTTVAASNPAPNSGDNVTFTVTVAPDSGSAAPTGTVTLVIDGGPTLGGSTTTATLTASGSASTTTYTTSFTTTGGHSVVAQYAGDSTFGASTGAASVTIGGSSSGTGSFTLGATDVSIPRGSSGSSTISVTPSGGYTGAVFLTFTTSNDTALTNLCYSFTTTISNGDGAVAIIGPNTVTTSLVFDTKASDCVTGGAAKPNGRTFQRLGALHSVAANHPRRPGPLPAGIAFAGLLLAGFLSRASRRFRTLTMLLLLLSIGFGLSACGGSGVSNPPKGTYTVTVVGQDSATASITASTTFTLTID